MPENMSPEQVKALKEKIEKMSPEELKEFQKQQCIFCHIIAGKVASKKVYEDDVCLAILDINPANPGHVVLMPKEHYPIMQIIPSEELAHISMVAKALSHVMLNSLKAKGTNIMIANGIAAGQRAQHFMLHIIPRKEGDNIGMELPKNKAENLSGMRDKIRELLGETKEIVNMDESREEVKEKVSSNSKKSKKKIKKSKGTKKKAVQKKSNLVKPNNSDDVSLDDIAGLFK